MSDRYAVVEYTTTNPENLIAPTDPDRLVGVCDIASGEVAPFGPIHSTAAQVAAADVAERMNVGDPIYPHDAWAWDATEQVHHVTLVDA